MKAHVNEGYDIIKDKDIDSRVKEACLLHHEKCDGTGYPFGLTSEKIPDFAKIIAIADIYDAMTSDRVYRSAVCPFTVIHLMEQECFQHLILSLHFHSLKMLHHHTFTTMSNFQMARQVKLYSLTTEV